MEGGTRMDTRVVAFVSLLVFAGCAAKAPLPPASEPEPAAQEPALDSLTDNPTEGVPLEVVMTGQVTTGRHMKLRGRIVNPHTQVVGGVRIQLAFLAPDDEGGAKVLELQQKEIGTTIEPGESTMLRWDVESIYLGGGAQFAVVAYPKRLGDRDMPPPDHWR